MSDENLLNVEDDPTPAAPEPPPPADPPVPSPPEEDADLHALDLKDEGRIKGLIGELSRTRAANRELKGAKEQLAQVQQELAESRPYVDFLRNNQHLMQPRQPEPQAPPPPDADPDAVEAARLMDFYLPDGKPDVVRGGQWLALQDRRAGRVAQQQIAPTVQQSLEQAANANYARLRNLTLPSGEKLKQEVVDGLWIAARREPNGLQTLANEQSVQALALLAIGAQSLGTRPAPVAPPPAQVTEPSGGRGGTPPVRLTPAEERTIAQRGMTPTQYAEHTKNFKPGVSNVLEND